MKRKLLGLLALCLALGGSVYPQRIVPISSGVVTANVNDNSSFQIFINRTITGVTFSHPAALPPTGLIVSIFFTQNSTGGFAVAFGGNITTSCIVDTTASSTTICQFQYTASSDTWKDPAGGGVSSPSSLTAFFNGYQGLTPQDCGNAACTIPDLTAGNGRQVVDGVATSGSAVVTSASAAFCDGASVPCAGFITPDVGKVIEIVCAGSSVSKTVLSVQSATQVTMSSTQSTCNGSAFVLFIGSDNTATLQNWVTNGMTSGKPHNFYLPKGLYYTTKPLRFVNTLPANECSALNANHVALLACGINIIGAGTTQAIIHPATFTNFQWTSGASDSNGWVVLSGWSFGTIYGWGAVGDAVMVASGLSNQAAGLLETANSHVNFSQLWIQGMTATSSGNNSAGLVSTNCFECQFTFNAIEQNGQFNVYLTPAEKSTWDTNFLEVPQSSQGNMFVNANGGTPIRQFRMTNMHFIGGTNTTYELLFQSGFTVAPGETLVLDKIRTTEAANTADLGIVFQTGCTGNIDINSPSLTGTANVSTQKLLWAQSGSNCNIGVNGGTLSTGASGTAIQNDGGASSRIYLSNVAPITGALSGTASAQIFGLIQTSTGWGGLGGITGTYFVSNQGTALGNGGVALSAGWQSTGSATVTAAGGFNQHFHFTVTTGTTTAANPTITVTLPNALPAATTDCELNQHGGTGAFTMVLQTTRSATAPIFTFQGTPTAGGSTYIYDGVCGP